MRVDYLEYLDFSFTHPTAFFGQRAPYRWLFRMAITPFLYVIIIIYYLQFIINYKPNYIINVARGCPSLKPNRRHAVTHSRQLSLPDNGTPASNLSPAAAVTELPELPTSRQVSLARSGRVRIARGRISCDPTGLGDGRALSQFYDSGGERGNPLPVFI